jgi:hypothetical protein
MADLILPWPLIITIEDVFVPDAAPYVVEGVTGLDDHTLRGDDSTGGRRGGV